MNNYVLFTDSACDIKPKTLTDWGVEYIELNFRFEGEDKDYANSDMKISEFYNRMRDGGVAKTSAVNPKGFSSAFEKLLKEGKDILYIGFSSGLSTTCNSAMIAADELSEKYPDRKIICIDSMRYSTALSLLVIKAAEKKAEGMDIEAVAEYIEKYKHTVHQIGPMDDLFFLVKTGRITNFKAFFGTLVGVSPMADFNEKGMSEVVAKFKGKKSAFDATLKYMEKTIENPQDQIIFVAHSNREAAAKLLAERIKETFAPKEVIINHVGMACGATVGPGLCAAFYHGKKISEGLAEEKEIMNEIVEQSKEK